MNNPSRFTLGSWVHTATLGRVVVAGHDLSFHSIPQLWIRVPALIKPNRTKVWFLVNIPEAEALICQSSDEVSERIYKVHSLFPTCPIITLSGRY